jgi:hypothetical protein
MNVRSTKPSPSPSPLGRGEATDARPETLPTANEQGFCAR